MEMTREDLLKLAKQAGYGTVLYGRPPKDGITVNEWDEEIWGGSMETSKLIRFAKLVIQAEREGIAPSV